jgi:hypothetical protein
MKISITWSTEDVAIRCEKLGVYLNAEQQNEVLRNVKRLHDAEVGINWDVIDAHIESYLEGR